MAEPQDHSQFIEQAQAFKDQLENAIPSFTAEEIAAMLGSFVHCVYQQVFRTEYPPELYEMLTKQSLVSDRMIAASEEDDEDA